MFFDEAQEMSEDYVVRLITRLRQRCQECVRGGVVDCDHMPHRAALSVQPGQSRALVAAVVYRRGGTHRVRNP